MAYCMSCGMSVDDGSDTCSNCGASVSIRPRSRSGGPAGAKRGPGRANPPSSYRPVNGNGGARRGRGSGFSLLVKVECVLLAIQLIIIAVVRPGLLTSDKKDPAKGGKTEQTAYGNGGEGEIPDDEEIMQLLNLTEEEKRAYDELEFVLTPENSPGNPALIQAYYTDADLASAKVYSEKVSTEKPEVSFDKLGISVNLYSWNIENSEDQLEVRPLPELHDEATGDSLACYDFSLASGKHEFDTMVEIKMPRKNKSEDTEIVYYDEETRLWTPVYYTFDEDGSYLISINHFTKVAEVLRKQGETLMKHYDGESLFYENINEKDALFQPVPVQQRSIHVVNLPDFEEMARKETISSEKLYEAFRAGRASSTTAFYDGCNALGMAADIGSNGQYASSFTAVGDRLSKTMWGRWFGQGVNALGVGLTLLKMTDRLSQNIPLDKVMSYRDFFSVQLGIVSALSAIANVPVVGSVCAFIAAGIFVGGYAWDKYEEAQEAKNPWGDRPDSLEEAVYRAYLSHYNSQVYPGVPLGLDGTGWTRVVNEVFEKYQYSLEPEAMGNELIGYFESFAGWYWDKFDRDQKDEILFAFKKNPEEYPDVYNLDRMTTDGKVIQELTKQEERIYKERVLGILFSKVNPILKKRIEDQQKINCVLLRQVLMNKLLPMLNQEIVFFPEDSSLGSLNKITASPYFGGGSDGFVTSMEFDCDKKAMFQPANYAEAGLKPEFCLPLTITDNDNPVLLTTNFYHYLQYGCPDKVKIKGNGKNLKDLEGKVEIVRGDLDGSDSPIIAYVKFASDPEKEIIENNFPEIDMEVELNHIEDLFINSLDAVSCECIFDNKNKKAHLVLHKDGTCIITVPAITVNEPFYLGHEAGQHEGHLIESVSFPEVTFTGVLGRDSRFLRHSIYQGPCSVSPKTIYSELRQHKFYRDRFSTLNSDDWQTFTARNDLSGSDLIMNPVVYEHAEGGYYLDVYVAGMMKRQTSYDYRDDHNNYNPYEEDLHFGLRRIPLTYEQFANLLDIQP